MKLVILQEQVPIGTAEVRAVFSSGSGRVAGCIITEGKVVKECGIRVIRKGKEVHVGVLESLRRVKEIVKEVCYFFEDKDFHVKLNVVLWSRILFLFITQEPIVFNRSMSG